MAGLLPNSVRSILSSARQVNARSVSVAAEVNVQSKGEIFARNHAIANPTGVSWPASSHIR